MSLLGQVMEHQNESETIDKNSKEDDDRSISEDRLRSSSSVSSASDIESAITDFSVEDHPHQIDRIEHGNFAVDEEEQLGDGVVETRRLGDDASALESPPPVQTMERPVSPSGYRIPSYVFARDKSTNPEWSIASNESLFSIHTGNMSFTRDQFNWLLRSGELSGNLGLSGDAPKSWELPPPSPRYVPKPATPKHVYPHNNEEEAHNIEEEEPVIPASLQETPKAGEEIIAAHFKTSIAASPSPQKQGDEFHNGGMANQPNHVTEPVDPVAGVKKDRNASSETREKRSSASITSDDVPLKNCTSQHSDASGQSFAFPVLAEIGREKSVNSGQSHIRPDLQKNSLEIDQEEANSPKAKTEAPPTFSSWFSSCFCCCCSCC